MIGLNIVFGLRGRSRRGKKANSNGGGGRENNPGNFANDREKASEAGRKGGQASHGGGQGR
ncbi:KGG domain-containing protein [Sphingomonas sp. 1185]|uniref:general stress protein n=1 Tax=Sphingomonas sp. 1185 TaxID=3156411 RepID=UPI003394774A